MPLEVTKLSRSGRRAICKESNITAPNKGFCVSQNMTYYGYKIHAGCSIKGIFKNFDISKVSVHDIQLFKRYLKSV